MSKTQFVEYAGRGFWSYDVALGIFMKHLLDVAEAPEHASVAWLQAALPRWKSVVAVAGSGLGWQIDEDWSGGEESLFLGLVERAVAHLSARENFAQSEIERWSVFSGVENAARGAPVVMVAPIVELGLGIQALVRSSLPNPPVGKTWFYGTPDGRDVL